MQPLSVRAFTMTSGLGRGLQATREAIVARRSGLAPCAFDTVRLDTWVGEVAGLDAIAWPAALEAHDCRNHRIAELALHADRFEARVAEAAARHGPARVGVFVGTSTSGILETERAYRARDPRDGRLPAGFRYAERHNTGALAAFVRARLGLTGPAWVTSAACASSAKVFATAQRLIAAGAIDAAVVGGVDSLCLTTLHGFASLELVSAQPCRPFDAARDGISIGEAAGFALLDRARADDPAGTLRLLGAGESSDAHHMSSPHPTGEGARRAMAQALAGAGLVPADVDYVNLHGTATPNNDTAEAQAVSAIFGGAVPCSSTKGATGHTLGAAGAIEAVLCLIALEDGRMPGGLHTVDPDQALGCRYLTDNVEAPLRHVLSNSFGFGGANCSLVFGRVH